MTDAGPIPTGDLPKGWVSADAGLTFDHRTAGLRVYADRCPGDADAEMAGASEAWWVWYERRVGETTERRRVGTVTTRDAAVDGLLTCMRRVSDGATPRSDGGAPSAAAPEDCRWAALSTLAEGVSFRDAIPSAEGDVNAASYARSWTERLAAEE